MTKCSKCNSQESWRNIFFNHDSHPDDGCWADCELYLCIDCYDKIYIFATNGEKTKDYKPLPMGKDGECQWPQECECEDCSNYHPLM